MLTLVKSAGVPNGAPHKCEGCGATNFKKSVFAFHCISCGQYYPAQLTASSTRVNLRRNLDELSDAHARLKVLLGQLAKIVKR